MTIAVAATAATAAEWAPTTSTMMTRWGKDISPEKAWPEYPRPQLEREKWVNLNGLWDVALRENAYAETPNFDRKILVPYPVESSLSGIGERANHVMYRRTIKVPADWKDQRVLLHFDAVDWQTSVTLNGTTLKTIDGDEIHQGGYDRFTYDITDHLKADDDNVLLVSVFDPTETGDQPRGKQVTNPHGIWYTPTTGIWQTVWLEPVSQKGSIRQVRFTPDAENSTVNIKALAYKPAADVQVELAINVGEGEPAIVTVGPDEEVDFKVPNAKLWSPESPHLYDVEVRLKSGDEIVDSAKTYFGLRDIEIRKSGDFQKIFLNGKEIFQTGPLDQGFWPDGIYTPPTDEALKWDIEYTMELGFNMIRKHIKVEPDRWYYHCDKMGMLVWQDAVNGVMKTPESKVQFEKDLVRMIDSHWSSPAIVLWVVFNEGWGQFDTERLTEMVMKKDPTRLVTNASGWVDKGVGHTLDMHKYPGPGAPDPDPNRASVLGEFGGLGLPIKGHAWEEKAWGYQGMETQEELWDRFSGMMNGLKFLREVRGLCASVYTQTTDVEIEINGLVTYDREVKKMDSAKVKALNDDLINMGELKVVAPTALAEPAPQWSYTTDKPADDWYTVEFSADDWKTSAAGFGKTTKRIFGPVGTVWDTDNIWIRRQVDIAEDVNVQNLQLIIVNVDEAEVYINGVRAAELKTLVTGYTPMDLSDEVKVTIKPGEKSTIAIHCRNTPEPDGKDNMGQHIDAGLIQYTPAN